MIRGVNKNVIEVLNPEDEYFERIIFFLNPNTPADAPLLSAKTDEYIGRLTGDVKRQKNSSQKAGLAAKLCAAAGAGGALVLLTQWLL